MGTQPTDAGDAPAGSPYEMRLALVLNGGVSLAVWMGGVTAEIDRMRRAAYPDLIAEPDPALERWQTLLGGLGVRLVVDVIAGASAGGLNGAVLAAAIARGRPLPQLRDTWRSVGSIANLASNADQPAGDRLSILNGSLLTQSVEDVFAHLENRPDASLPADLRVRLRHEETAPRGVTLFTTATSMRGQAEEFTDSTSQRFPQVEYRVVCRFRRALLGDDEFNDATANARLTRAARASASFPAAFEPAFFAAGDDVDDGHPQAEQVSMRETAGIRSSRWMVDGGVLDNEPFAPVLDRIARRPITRDVDRIVAYIDPEDATRPPGDEDIGSPPGMVAAVSAALNLPRETNLLNQLHRLGEMEREIAVDIDADPDLLRLAFAGSLDTAAAALEPVYAERRDAAVVHEIRLLLQSGGEPDDPAVPIDELARPDAAGAPAGEWTQGIAAAERVLRIALNMTRTAATNGANAPPVADALFEISVSVIQLAQLRQEVQEAVVAHASGAAAALSDDEIRALLRTAMTADRRALIAVLVAAGVEKFLAADVWPAGLTAPAGDAEAQRAAFLDACRKIEIVRHATGPISAYHPIPSFRFCRFGANVGTPYWCEGRPIRGKLMGLRLHHFGGFLQSGWRKYDWMWGRLDGATHLVRMLIGRLTEPPELPREQLRADLHAWVGTGYEGALDSALDTYLDAPARTAEMFDRLTLELVRPLHRGIFCEELGIDPAAADVDAQISKGFEAASAQVRDETIGGLADSEDGRRVIGQLGAAGLRALGNDAALPAKARLRPVLRVAADVVLADTQPGAERRILRVGYVIAVVVLALAPFFLGRWLSGVALGVASGVCAFVLGLLLAASVLVLPKQGAALLRRMSGLVHVWPVSSAIGRAEKEIP